MQPHGDEYHWLDVERIAEELSDRHPDRDPVTISFPELKSMVERLPGFLAQEGHPCNERILEAVQQAWMEEQEG